MSPTSLPEATCSTVSRALAEPLFATASHVRAWLLVEQAGPWGGEPLVDSRLDPAVGRERAHIDPTERQCGERVESGLV